MKLALIYLSAFALFISLVAFSINWGNNPENLLIGEWEEIGWEYEKIDPSPETYTISIGAIDQQQKSEISQNLVIHKAEKWQFRPTGEIKLIKQNGTMESLEWRIKGRGNILKLIYGSKNEHYQIQKLNPKLMEIHFNSDLQARGIVKMTFQKSQN